MCDFEKFGFDCSLKMVLGIDEYFLFKFFRFLNNGFCVIFKIFSLY